MIKKYLVGTQKTKKQAYRAIVSGVLKSSAVTTSSQRNSARVAQRHVNELQRKMATLGLRVVNVKISRVRGAEALGATIVMSQRLNCVWIGGELICGGYSIAKSPGLMRGQKKVARKGVLTRTIGRQSDDE